MEERRELGCVGRDLLIDSLVHKRADVSQSAQDLCRVGGRGTRGGGEGEGEKCAKKSLCCFPEHWLGEMPCCPKGGKAGQRLLLKTGSHRQPHSSCSQADLCRMWAPLMGGSAYRVLWTPQSLKKCSIPWWVHVRTTQGATLWLYFQYQQEVSGLWASWSEAGDAGGLGSWPMRSVHRNIDKANKVTQILHRLEKQNMVPRQQEVRQHSSVKKKRN